MIRPRVGFAGIAWGKKLMTDSHNLIDAAKYLRDLELGAKRSAPEAIEIHPNIARHGLLLQSDRCRRFGLVVNELVEKLVGRFVGKKGRIHLELMQEADLVHCAVSHHEAGPSTGVAGLEVAHQLAKTLRGRIGHWFDHETTSLVLTIPLTERERQANQILLAGILEGPRT